MGVEGEERRMKLNSETGMMIGLCVGRRESLWPLDGGWARNCSLEYRLQRSVGLQEMDS